jgi:hypothetical protein
MKTHYDPSQPIEAFIDQIEDAVALADAANAPYTTAQIIAIPYNLIFTAGMFPDACRDWRRVAQRLKRLGSILKLTLR